MEQNLNTQSSESFSRTAGISSILGQAAIPLQPWSGLAHANHTEDQLEPLLRALRFASIQINRLWVEIQSFPFFMKGLKTASVREIETILTWIQASPAWNEIVPDSTLVPLLSQPESRQALLEFVRDSKCVLALLGNLGQSVNEELLRSQNFSEISKIQEALTQIITLGAFHGFQELSHSDLDFRIEGAQERWQRTRLVMGFFLALSDSSGIPRPQNRIEAQRLFEAMKCIRAIPSKILPWRIPQVLAPGQRVRIEAWQGRAKPTLEARKKLTPFLNLTDSPRSEDLRDMGAKIRDASFWSRLKPAYREAIRTYQSFLIKVTKEKPFEISERLSDWASFLDQKKTFESNFEARNLFDHLFKGIDTDFETASQANVWANQVKKDLTWDGLPYANRLVEFIFTAPEANFELAKDFFDSEGAQSILNALEEPEFLGEDDLSQLETAQAATLRQLTQLKDLIFQLGITADLKLSNIKDLRSMAEEVDFFLSKIESNTQAKHALKANYAGHRSDLSSIENAMVFVKFIEKAALPEAMAQFFLSSHGPQRFGENRALVPSAVGALASTKEHLRTLESITFGSTSGFAQTPVVQVMEKLQAALKSPGLFKSCVESLRT